MSLILLVEDDLKVSQRVVPHLRRMFPGNSIVTATDADPERAVEVALRMLDPMPRSMVAAVICDGLDGECEDVVNFCSARSIPIVVFTSEPQRYKMLAASRDMGLAEKPDLRKLAETVERMVAKSQTR